MTDLMNNLYPSIKFTVDIGGSKINFMVLTISILPDKFKFEIYRKTTAADMLIHGTSFCPFALKLAASNAFIHRLVSLPSRLRRFQLKYLAYVNNVPIDIEKMAQKNSTRVALSRITRLPPFKTGRMKRAVVIPYLPIFFRELGEVPQFTTSF